MSQTTSVLNVKTTYTW